MATITLPHTFSNGATASAPDVNDNFTAITAQVNGAIDYDNLSTATKQKLGLSDGSVTRRGAVNIPTAESTSATTYAIGNLATPDRVTQIVLPTDGLIVVAYQAIWRNSAANDGRAALFLNTTQVCTGSGTTASSASSVSGPFELADDGLLYTDPSQIARLGAVGGVGNATEVTTGQVVGGSSGGPVAIFASAGTYDVSVQFKVITGGQTLTVKNRHLWVWTMAF